MPVAKSIMAGLGAGLVGALVLGIAGNVAFDLAFTAFPLGNSKDRAVTGFLVGFQSALLGMFLGFFWATSRAREWVGMRYTFLGFSGLVGAYIAFTVFTYTQENEPPFQHSIAHVEIRLPAGAAVPPKGPNGESYQLDKIDVWVLHDNTWRGLAFEQAWMRRDGDRVVIMAQGWLGRGRKPLAFNLVMPGPTFRQFDVDLAPDPEPTDGFSTWQRVSSIRNSGESKSQTPDPADTTEMRFRISKKRS